MKNPIYKCYICNKKIKDEQFKRGKARYIGIGLYSHIRCSVQRYAPET